MAGIRSTATASAREAPRSIPSGLTNPPFDAFVRPLLCRCCLGHHADVGRGNISNHCQRSNSVPGPLSSVVAPTTITAGSSNGRQFDHASRSCAAPHTEAASFSRLFTNVHFRWSTQSDVHGPTSLVIFELVPHTMHVSRKINSACKTASWIATAVGSIDSLGSQLIRVTSVGRCAWIACRARPRISYEKLGAPNFSRMRTHPNSRFSLPRASSMCWHSSANVGIHPRKKMYARFRSPPVNGNMYGNLASRA